MTGCFLFKMGHFEIKHSVWTIIRMFITKNGIIDSLVVKREKTVFKQIIFLTVSNHLNDNF
jgi:hypothetical protein